MGRVNIGSSKMNWVEGKRYKISKSYRYPLKSKNSLTMLEYFLSLIS